MTTELSRPWVRRYGLPIHTGLALPWAVEAVAIVLLASTDRPDFWLAAIPVAAAGVALLLTRQWWLVLAAILGAVAGVASGVGVGLNYIDHSPESSLAKLALDAFNIASIVGLAACVVAIVVGVLEWRAFR